MGHINEVGKKRPEQEWGLWAFLPHHTYVCRDCSSIVLRSLETPYWVYGFGSWEASDLMHVARVLVETSHGLRSGFFCTTHLSRNDHYTTVLRVTCGKQHYQ